MRYIIMADGKGERWQNYGGIPKHLIQIGGETLLERTVRLIKTFDRDGEVIITSHDPRYEVAGAVRYEPLNNHLEIDRFTEELIADNVVFLYGDTFYEDDSMKAITEARPDQNDILFFGNTKSIVAIRVKSGAVFKAHVDRVRELFVKGEIDRCIGWQVYQSYVGLPFGEKIISGDYILLGEKTEDFNTPSDFISRTK